MQLRRDKKGIGKELKHGWQVMFERSRDAMLMFDNNLTVIEVNQAGQTLCNVGNKLSDLESISSDDQERRSIQSTIDWVMENNLPCEGRIIYLAKRHANVQVDVYPVEYPVQGVVLIICDVTESLNNDARLQNPDNLLRLGMTAAGITHELSNPLTSLYSELELMAALKNGPDPHLDNCLKLVQRMHHILRELSGAFDTHATLIEQPVSVKQSIKQAIQLLRFCPEINQVKVDLDFTDNLPLLLITEKHLLLLLENICENAIKAIKAAGDDGPIKISARGSCESGITVSIINSSSVSHGDSYWLQADKYQQGMGVGLAISKQIMNSYSGKLSISKNEDGSTRVEFYFPPNRCLSNQQCNQQQRDGAEN